MAYTIEAVVGRHELLAAAVAGAGCPVIGLRQGFALIPVPEVQMPDGLTAGDADGSLDDAVRRLGLWMLPPALLPHLLRWSAAGIGRHRHTEHWLRADPGSPA